MKKFSFVSFLFFYVGYGLGIPNPAYLKRIYSISDAKGIGITYLPEYKDITAYGQLPYCMQPYQLFSLNSTLNWDDNASFQIKSSKDLYIAQVQDAYVSPDHLGTVFDAHQQFLFEILVHPGSALFWPIENGIHGRRIIHYNKLATVQGPTLFYHWVIDRLPSVYLLKNIILSDPDIKFMVNAKGAVPGYVREYLDLLGIPLHKIIFADNRALYHADNVYFATPFLMEPIPRQLLLDMREALVDAASNRVQKDLYNNNLIVVIQRRESDRKIQNIEKLIRHLRKTFADKGYRVITFDASMSVAEQIMIFNNAKLVIGVMASGLTNVVYMKPDTFVIEIHPELKYLADSAGVNKYGAEWCWWLASAVGAHYSFVTSPFNLSDSRVVCPIEDMKRIIANISQFF